MTQPNFPLILIDKNEVLNLIPTVAELTKPIAFGGIRQTDQALAFDGNGYKWTYRLSSPQPKITVPELLLNYILYNPVIEIKLEWIRQDMYPLQELQEVIHRCIMKSDDATQPGKVDILKTHISVATSFSDLYKALSN